jgi:hypothetical protein
MIEDLLVAIEVARTLVVAMVMSRKDCQCRSVEGSV